MQFRGRRLLRDRAQLEPAARPLYLDPPFGVSSVCNGSSGCG